MTGTDAAQLLWRKRDPGTASRILRYHTTAGRSGSIWTKKYKSVVARCQMQSHGPGTNPMWSGNFRCARGGIGQSNRHNIFNYEIQGFDKSKVRQTGCDPIY